MCLSNKKKRDKIVSGGLISKWRLGVCREERKKKMWEEKKSGRRMGGGGGLYGRVLL